MPRRSTARLGSLLLFILAGIIIGTIVGNILAVYFNDFKLFTETYELGTKGTPRFIDLSIIKIALGFTLRINFGTVLGLILGLIFYYNS